MEESGTETAHYGNTSDARRNRSGLKLGKSLWPTCWLWSILATAVLLSGCATPYGVAPAGLRGAYEETSTFALTSTEASNHARIILRRYDLLDLYTKAPEAALEILDQKIASGDDRRDLRFALAELSFLYAEKLEKKENADTVAQAPDRYLTAAVYAYAFLFGQSKEEPPSEYDNRFRQACVLYNRALAKGLATGPRGQLAIRSETRDLPIGQLAISVKSNSAETDPTLFESFRSADDYLVRGFSIRNREAGLGAPLIALNPKSQLGSKVVPLTAFLRIEGNLEDFSGGKVRAKLEIYSVFGEEVTSVNDRPVPLERDVTTGIAYAVNDPSVWSLDLQRFFLPKAAIQPQLIMPQPHKPGMIPIVFVHGTASEATWWFEMFNTLYGDPLLRSRYQFWFFRYNSAYPVMSSAVALRNLLQEKYQELDPDKKDPALTQMVVIGHSQGGLLTKTAVVSTGDRLWRAVSDTPLEQMEIDADGQSFLRDILFIEPLPFVKRVVFIATPHRGSFLAKNWIASFLRRIIGLPADIMKGAGSFLTIEKRLKLPVDLEGRMPTSIDGMSPSNPIIMALADTPIVPGVAAHSIIAIKDNVQNKEGDDGVVEYRSAHLPGVKSEFVVQSEHSCQQHPLTIEEIRRILLEHLTSIGSDFNDKEPVESIFDPKL